MYAFLFFICFLILAVDSRNQLLCSYLVDARLHRIGICGYGYISMDIHEKHVDMDMDVIFHIHGNPGNNAWTMFMVLLS